MGKKNFENWVSAQQIRIPSSFKTEAELVSAVRLAGYDAEKYGTFIKTHIDEGRTFLFWEQENGRWVAIFSKHDDLTILKQFASDVERVAGVNVFGDLGENSIIQGVARYPTNFRDGAMLVKALSEFGTRPVKRADGTILCKIENSELLFTQSGDAPFTVEVRNSPNLEQVYLYMSSIDDDYKRCVQDAVYEKIKSRAAEKNMVLESEDILPDKTIVMTLRIR